MVPHLDIESNLATLAREVTRSRLRLALSKSGVGALASLAAAVGLCQLGLARIALGVLGLGLLLSTGAYLWAMLRRAGRAGAYAVVTATARLAERLAPELGTSPSSALDFSRRLAVGDEASYSRELALLHLERTSGALHTVDWRTRWRQQKQVGRRRSWLVLGALACAAALTIAVLPAGRRRLLGMMINPGAAQLVDAPLAADIRITYHYPSYTGLAERTVEGGDGSLAAVVGTEVELWANCDDEVHSALFKMDADVHGAASAVPMTVSGRRIGARFQVQRDGRYHFALTTSHGEKLEERQSHTITALADTPPTVTMVAPLADVELRDNQNVTLAYAAKDDFGIAKVELVVEVAGADKPTRTVLAANSEATPKSEGAYTWHVAELSLPAGAAARFYLEATDNNAIAGPQHGVSVSRRLVLFSAQKHHDDLMARQQRVLDAMVDWLAGELETPLRTPALAAEADQDMSAGRRLLEVIRRHNAELGTLVPLLRDDKMTSTGIATAFANTREHAQRAERERSQLLARLGGSVGTAAPANRAPLYQALTRARRHDIDDLEKDIIYLDDLLAIERIDQLKGNAKDLLAAQRRLQKLLTSYKDTKDPAVRQELTRRIAELKAQMLEMLAKMASIKQQLPGEYRNLESASQLAVGDELERIERALAQGDLDNAARELEQLAGMIETLADRLGNAEQRYGGERYDEVRKQLADFAAEFGKLDNEQQGLAKRSEELARELRDKTLERVGSKLDDFVQKARDKTAQALKQLDQVQVPPQGLFGVSQPLQQSRERLIDLDGLLGQKDFVTALRMADEALKHQDELRGALDARVSRYGQSAPDFKRAGDATARAQRLTREVADLLGKLFPDAGQVLGKAQLERLRAMSRKQAELEGKAGKLAERMNELAMQVPLFGGEPRGSLESARGEMSQASRELGAGELPGGAQHGRQASDELGKLRRALEQASKSGNGGLPLPLAMGGQTGSGNEAGGNQSTNRDEDVHIPDADKNRAAPQFRKELLDAAKQKAPVRYEDAVRRYYEELIR